MGQYSVGPISFQGVSTTVGTATAELGERKIFNGSEYLYCYNGTGSSVTQGALMVMSGLSGYTMTRSSTESADLPMVCAANTSIADGQYFWGLVRGVVSVMSIAVAAGDLIGVGDDGAIKTAVTGSFPTGPIVGKALETTTGNAQPSCYVKLFG